MLFLLSVTTAILVNDSYCSAHLCLPSMEGREHHSMFAASKYFIHSNTYTGRKYWNIEQNNMTFTGKESLMKDKT